VKFRQEVTEVRTVAVVVAGASKWHRQAVTKERTVSKDGGGGKGPRNEFVVKADVIVSAQGTNEKTSVLHRQRTEKGVVNSQNEQTEKTAVNTQEKRTEKTDVSSEEKRTEKTSVGLDLKNKTVLTKNETENSRVLDDTPQSAENSKSVIVSSSKASVSVDSKTEKNKKTIDKGKASKDETRKGGNTQSDLKTADSKSSVEVEKTSSTFVGSVKVVKKGPKMADKEKDDEGDKKKDDDKEPEKEKDEEEKPETPAKEEKPKTPEKEEKPKTPEKEEEPKTPEKEEDNEEEKEPEKQRMPSPEPEKQATPEPEKAPSPEPEKEPETAPSPEPEPETPEPEKDNESPEEKKDPEPEAEAPVEPGPQEQDAPEEDEDEDSEDEEEVDREVEAKKARQEKIDSTLSALDALIDNQLNSVLKRPQTSGNGPTIPQEKLDELLNGEFSTALDRYLQGDSDGTDLMDKCLEVLG
jgi:hypothetical protein